jgi:hypothetical protein
MNTSATKSLRELAAAAENGDINAQRCLADVYLEQENEEGNKAAIPWLKKAARQGDPWAQYQLGYSYQAGLGLPKNKKQAQHYYELSASQGYDSAVPPWIFWTQVCR